MASRRKKAANARQMLGLYQGDLPFSSAQVGQSAVTFEPAAGDGGAGSYARCGNPPCRAQVDRLHHPAVNEGGRQGAQVGGGRARWAGRHGVCHSAFCDAPGPAVGAASGAAGLSSRSITIVGFAKGNDATRKRARMSNNKALRTP